MRLESRSLARNASSQGDTSSFMRAEVSSPLSTELETAEDRAGHCSVAVATGGNQAGHRTEVA